MDLVWSSRQSSPDPPFVSSPRCTAGVSSGASPTRGFEPGLGLFGRVLVALVAVTVLVRCSAARHEVATKGAPLALLVAFAAIGCGQRHDPPRATRHPCVALEHGTFVDDQRGAVDVGLNARSRAQRDRLAGDDVPGDVAL